MKWSTEATHQLMELCKENAGQLRDAPKDAPIYQEMADQLVMFGPNANNVRRKMKSLKKRNCLEFLKVDEAETSSAAMPSEVKPEMSKKTPVIVLKAAEIANHRRRRFGEELLVIEAKKLKAIESLVDQMKTLNETALQYLGF